MSESGPDALLLTRRLGATAGVDAPETVSLRLALTAEERSRLRGHRRSLCGRDLLLQLERGAPLQPGEWLAGEAGDPPVRVDAACEPLLRVRAADPLQLLQAAYHLGNRHVALELRPAELRLLWDPVLADLLARRGLLLERLEAPFLLESGAYADGHHHEGGEEQAPRHDHHPLSRDER